MKPNNWLIHLAKIRKQNPKLKISALAKLAKSSYKK